MLRVTTIYANTANASARYYTRYLAGDNADEEGVWLGSQAEDLGLSGMVSTDELEASLSGHDPVTGQQLGSALVDRVGPKGKLIKAVAGYDACFSAPKSVSAWWGLTGDPGVSEAHDVAVRAVLAHLERYGTTARPRVNGRRQYLDTGGLVMAAFRQSTSREDDPQLHTHVVISTKVQTPDGRWWAMDARWLKRKQRALGGLYQSVLRAELSHRYGITWTENVNGQADVAGMPAEVLEVFSKRTRQVDVALKYKLAEFRDREGRDPTRWERAALTREAAADSRQTKNGVTSGELQQRWQDEAAALGWTPPSVVAAMHDTARTTPPITSKITVEAVLERMSEQGSSWTRAEVLQAICDLTGPPRDSDGTRWAAILERACAQVMTACTSLDPAHDGPVRVSDGRSVWLAPMENNLTHDRILAQEERIVVFALHAQDETPRPSSTVDRDGLDVLQADAAEAVARHDRLVLIEGPAGTGKTTMLKRAVDDLYRQHRAVFGLSPTAKGANVLGRETGMPADTVAKLLYEWRHPHGPREHYRLPPGTTVVVDEAGMLGTGNLDELIHLAQAQQWRVVMVGDPRQLQAVGRGGMFDELCRTGRVHQLATIHRFHHPWEAKATLQLRHGHIEAIDAYLAHGRVHAGTLEDHLESIANQWIDRAANGHTAAVGAQSNDHVDRLNAAIQELRRQLGHLDPRQVVDVAGDESVSVGDHIVTRRNNRQLRTSRGEPVRNREAWEVTAVGADGSLTVSHLEGHGDITLPADYVREHVRLGYAATAHGHEGDTLDGSLSIVTDTTSLPSLYVEATRGRFDNHLFVVTDEPDLAQARDVLEQVLHNNRSDIPAVVQRQHLAEQVPRPARTHQPAAPARPTSAEFQRLVAELERRAGLAARAMQAAEQQLRQVAATYHLARVEVDQAQPWARRRLEQAAQIAADALADARQRYANAESSARSSIAQLQEAQRRTQGRKRDHALAHLDRLRSFRSPSMGPNRDGPGLGR